MKAQLATPAAGSPALSSAATATAPRLASMIGNRATREARTGANALPRSPPPSTLRVQLARSVGRAPSGHQRHPARTYGGEHGDAAIHAAAARGIATPWSVLPHASRIQHSFGRHDISSIQAHVGGTAAASATEIHADAYTTGNHVVLGRAADLFTVAHEAAHVVQQRAGVQLKGGVGAAGDQHERHADAVAARVTAGQSAEGLLDQYAGHGAGDSQVQCRTRIVDHPRDPRNTVAPGEGTGLLLTSEGNIDGDVVFGPLLNDCATYMEARLTLNYFDPGGTEPQAGTWPNWWAAAAPKPNNYWVRGHLLNHNLGGPGEKRNLTPITKRANSEHHNVIERVLKDAAEDSMIHYSVKPVYGAPGPTFAQDGTNPDPSVWHMLTHGFECEYNLIDDQDQQHLVRHFVRNVR